MTATTRSTAAIAALLACTILATAGACGGPAPEPAPTFSSTSSTPGASAAPTPTATAGESTGVPEVPIDCDTIIPQSRQDSLAGSGLTLTPPADFFAKVASEGQPSVYNLFQANGGIVCAWGNGSEVVSAYGYSPLPTEQAENAAALIQGSDPYSVSEYAGGTLYTSQMDGNPFTFFLIVDTHIYLATTTEILDELKTAIS